MLSCGVANIQLIAGSESAIQIHGMASEGSLCDNVCMLVRFIRNQVFFFWRDRVAPTVVANNLAAMTFVLDRHHRSNHRACLDEGHNESFNAWLDNLVPNVRHMTPTTLQVYTLLVADLWNQWVIRPGQTEVRTRTAAQIEEVLHVTLRCLVRGKICVFHDTLHHQSFVVSVCPEPTPVCQFSFTAALSSEILVSRTVGSPCFVQFASSL